MFRKTNISTLSRPTFIKDQGIQHNAANLFLNINPEAKCIDVNFIIRIALKFNK